MHYTHHIDIDEVDCIDIASYPAVLHGCME